MASEVDDQHEVVNGWLGDKSTSTLTSRAFSTVRFLDWCCKNDVQPFHLTEKICIAYVDFEKKSGAPATRILRFQQTMAFLKHVVNFPVHDGALASGKVKSANGTMMKKKRETKRAAPFTVKVVEAFEKGTQAKYTLARRIFCGHMAFLIHTRSRLGDHMHIDAEPKVHGALIFAEAGRHITSHQVHRDSRLPMLGNAVGVSGIEWRRLWLEARSTAGLSAGPGKPFLPCPSSLYENGWGIDALTSSEAGSWANIVWIDEGFDREALGDTGVH